MFLLWMQLNAAALDPSPVTTEPAVAPEISPDSAQAPLTNESTSPPPAIATRMELALNTQIKPGHPWAEALTTTVSALGEPTSQEAEMRCWLFEHTQTSCTYWHLTSGTTAQLGPGGDSTPVVRFVGAGRANGSTHLPPCCRLP